MEVTAYASLDKIKAAVAPLIEREFPEGEDEPTFTVGSSHHHLNCLTCGPHNRDLGPREHSSPSNLSDEP